MTSFSQLVSPDNLLSLGMTLVVVGIVLRGFARQSKRAQSLRKQHELYHRKLDAPDQSAVEVSQPDWLERHLPLLANLVLGIGVLLTLISYFR
ncbi:MAG: hypothetical protein WCR49_01430 [Opitutae bacterium]